MASVNYRASTAKFSELTTGPSGVSNASETVPIKVGVMGFNSDNTPGASRASSYTAPGSILVQRGAGADSPRGSDTPRASLLGGGVLPMNVDGSSKKVCLCAHEWCFCGYLRSVSYTNLLLLRVDANALT